MGTISRRKFLSSTAAPTAAFALGNISGCAAPVPETPDSGTGSQALKTRVHPLEGIERENIKITDVKVTLLSYELPPEEQLLVFKGIWWKTDAIIVEVFTDKGIVGVGGASRYGGDCELKKKYIEDVAKPSVLGKNPFDVELLTCGGGAYHKRCAWAGIESALWDIIGKAKNMPVYKLLAIDHEPNPHIPVYASGGVQYAWYDRPEDLIDEALRHKEKGYNAFKYRAGTDWAYNNIAYKQYIPLLRKMREAVGPDFDLMQESMGGTGRTLEEIIEELCPAMEELKFLWFEQPLGEYFEGAIEAHVKINEALPTVMVSGAEKMLNRFEMKEWIDRGAYDIVQPDASIVGINETWMAARMANLYGKLVCPHSWQDGTTRMQNAHLSAGIPNLLKLEAYEASIDPLKTEIFKEPLVVKNSFIDLPDKPGFGVELAPDLEKKFPYIPGNFVKPNPIFSG